MSRPVFEQVGIAWDGDPWSASFALSGYRRGYHISHVITPYVGVRLYPGAGRALEVFTRFHAMEPIIWRKQGDRFWWMTLAEHRRRVRLVGYVRKRERGLRTTIRALAIKFKCSTGSIVRMLKGLERTGELRIERVRGRRGYTRIRMFAGYTPPPAPPPMHGRNINDAAATTGAVAPAEKPLDGEFWERLRAQAEARRAEVNDATPW